MAIIPSAPTTSNIVIQFSRQPRLVGVVEELGLHECLRPQAGHARQPRPTHLLRDGMLSSGNIFAL